MAVGQRSSRPPKVLLNDRVCVVAPEGGGGGGGASPDSVRLSRPPPLPPDALSACSGSARSLSATLTRAGALHMRLENSVSQEFFCTSIAETDVQSSGGGRGGGVESRLENSEHPPSIESLQETTRRRFSAKWLKYMYAKFKNECPSGRMRVHEFKRLLGAYVPDRISDGYLERMFYAMCDGAPSGYADQLTFRDMMVSLALLFDDDPRESAEWTVRLINAESRTAAGVSDARVHVEDFVDFVKSVCLLAGRTLSVAGGGQRLRGSSARSSDSALAVQSTRQRPPPPPPLALPAGLAPAPPSGSLVVVRRATLAAIRQKAMVAFKELDAEHRGYLTVDDFERLFRSRASLLQ